MARAPGLSKEEGDQPEALASSQEGHFQASVTWLLRKGLMEPRAPPPSTKATHSPSPSHAHDKQAVAF